MKYKKIIVKRSIDFIIRNVLLNRSYLEFEAHNYGTTVGKIKANYELYYHFWDELYEISKKNRKFHPNYDPVNFKIKFDDRVKLNKERIHPRPNLGKKFSDETREKMSLASKGKKKSAAHKSKLGVHKRKPVVMLDAKNEVVYEWPSVKDTISNLAFNNSKGSGIRKALQQGRIAGLQYKSNIN